MVPAALRTRARNLAAPAFLGGRDNDSGNGIPREPAIIPDETKWSFIDAFWHSLSWRQASWLGTKVDKAPTDLFAYQELIERVRPDWIIETGTGTGGRALFLASVCELLGTGQVVSIDADSDPHRPMHPRVQYLTGSTYEAETVERVRALTGDGRALVVLGSWLGTEQTRAEFNAYEPFVPTGSYVVVEGTIVNGHPVWPAFGKGPAEAVRAILSRHKDFVADEDAERYGLTFNRGGFLRRA
jgi:cephalosporin hydroxylase